MLLNSYAYNFTIIRVSLDVPTRVTYSAGNIDPGVMCIYFQNI